MSDSDYTEEEEEEFRDDMRVFLRLRPINKLEQSRRSKNCIELHEDPTLVTVDSPLEGEYDYTFDHVFEEYATQEEVFEHAVADVPHSLMEGYNCTVIAYGQTGTGKTHSMLGVNGASDGLLQKSTKMMGGKSISSIMDNPAFDETTRDAGNHLSQMGESKSTLSINLMEDLDPECEGMIPRTIASIFQLMKKATPTTEFTIRVSYVEIYLEKILDLLHPQGTTGITIEEEEQADKAAGPTVTPAGVRIKGASELCCLDEGDVCALLTRGNACRTMSSTEMNTESSRSHAIFVLRLEQTDRLTSTSKTSVLHMVDLAGSELASKDANKRKSMVATICAVQTEENMINKSLSALNKMIRAQLAYQQGEKNIPLDSISRQSKLTRLLRPSFGGNCLTTLLLTASPSSYNIGETISTINFGQRCRRIYNDPNIVETEPVHVYKKQVQEFKSNYEDAMALARALASECLRMRDGESTGEGPLWDTIKHLGSKVDPPPDFKVTIKQKKTKLEGIDEEEEEEEEVSYFANEKVKMEDEIESLKEANEFLTRQRQDADGNLAELQSEVAVLRTQNENLSAEKQRNVEDLVNAKNEVQSLSQRKLEVEQNFRTSQFRENEVIVFLRQFRRFYRNVLKDKAAHGAGSIQAITAEVTDKVPNAPNLNDLRDVDCLLVESGILEDYEMGEDKASGSYIPSREALMRSAGAAQRAAAAENDFLKEAMDSSDDDDQYIAQSITQVAGPLRLPGPGVQLDMVTELNNTVAEVKQDESSNESDATERDRRAGADAGAGMIAMDDRSFLSSDAESLVHSIARPLATGLLVTRRQRLLNTPAGRLTILRETDLEKELLEISERCIDLQMALNEEKAVVDALTNKSGGLSKKRLAQEAISLRQQLEKKTASLTAIAWKMNELNLINKTYNEKMASREQHVLYLEEQLVELQNNNRRLIVERVESEKKLRDEVENLYSIVGGMTIPLWQFGEKNIIDKPLATRVVITAVGGDPALEFDPFERRKSVGNEEPEMEFPSIPDVPLYDDPGEVEDDFSPDNGEMPVAPKRPKRKTSDKLRMSVFKLRSARALMRTMEKSGDGLEHIEDNQMEDALATIAAQELDEEDGAPVIVRHSLETDALPPVLVQKCDVETQTDDQELSVKLNAQAQTEEVQVFDLDVSVTVNSEKPETYEADVQTDEVQVFNIDTAMIPGYDREMYDAQAQTEEVQVFDLDVSVAVESEKPETYEADVQTDEVQVFDIDTVMIPSCDKEMYDADVQTDEVQVFDIAMAMVPGHDEVVTNDCGAQTDDEPLKQAFERNVQTDDVEFAIEVEKDDAYAQTDEVVLDNAYAQTEEVDIASSFAQTDVGDTYAVGTMTSAAIKEVLHGNDFGTMTDRQDEEPTVSMSQAFKAATSGAPAGGGAYAVSADREVELEEESLDQEFDSEDEGSSGPPWEQHNEREADYSQDEESDEELVVAQGNNADDIYFYANKAGETRHSLEQNNKSEADSSQEDFTDEESDVEAHLNREQRNESEEASSEEDYPNKESIEETKGDASNKFIDINQVGESRCNVDHNSVSEADSSQKEHYDEASDVEAHRNREQRNDSEEASSEEHYSDDESIEETEGGAGNMSIDVNQVGETRCNVEHDSVSEVDSSQEEYYDDESVEGAEEGELGKRYSAVSKAGGGHRNLDQDNAGDADSSQDENSDERSVEENGDDSSPAYERREAPHDEAHDAILNEMEQLGENAYFSEEEDEEQDRFESEDESDSKGSADYALVGGKDDRVKNDEVKNDEDSIERVVGDERGNHEEGAHAIEGRSGGYDDREDIFEGGDSNYEDSEDTLEGEESNYGGGKHILVGERSDYEDGDIVEEVEPTKVPVKEKAAQGLAVGRSAFLTRQQSETSYTQSRSLDCFTFSRSMPPEDPTLGRASNRFMPDEEGLTSSRRLANRRFWVDDDEPTKNEKLRLSPAASSRRVKTMPLLEQGASEKYPREAADGDNDMGYDDLGTRWGLTDDEIAADAAVLTTTRRYSTDALLSSDDDDDDVMQETLEEAVEADEPEAAHDIPDSDSSEDGDERDLFENNFDLLKRSYHSSSTGQKESAARSERLQEQCDSQSDKEETPDYNTSKISEDSFTDDDSDMHDEERHDDGFEKMMTETAAALAAAQELMGDDNDAIDDDQDDETDFDDDVELSSDDNEEYISEDRDSDDGDEMEYRSAQDHRFSVKDEEQGGNSQEKKEKLQGPDPSMFEGGKPQEYEVRRFTAKLGRNIKPAVMKGGPRKVDQHTDDEGSIVSTASTKNREAPQQSPLQARVAMQSGNGDTIQASTHSARSSSMDKNSPSSQKRDDDRNRRKQRSHRSGEDRDRRSRRSREGGEAKEREHRPRREVDKGGESKERRSRRKEEDGGERRHHRRSRRGEESGGHRGHRSSRGTTGERHTSSRGLNEGGGSGRRQKSSRRMGDGGGSERRQKSNRDSNGEDDGERRHRSRRHRSNTDGNAEGEEDNRRGRDEDKRRKKKSSSSRHRSDPRRAD